MQTVVCHYCGKHSIRCAMFARRLTDDAGNSLRGLILTVLNKVQKLLVELGIRTEDAAGCCHSKSFVIVICVYSATFIPFIKNSRNY